MTYLILIMFAMLTLVAGLLRVPLVMYRFARTTHMHQVSHLLSTGRQLKQRAFYTLQWYNDIIGRKLMLKTVLPAHELWLREMYERDPSFAYECDSSDLQMLLAIFGEMEPIVDAINARNGVSIEQRARDIGCSAEDFSWAGYV
jgi:hypothetical protein